MKVFKACIIITRRRLSAVVTYLGIFIALCVMMTSFSHEKLSTDFTLVKPSYSIIQRDHTSPLIEGLKQYLEGNGSAVELTDSTEALQDAAFYHASEYILIIPEGFSAAFSTDAALDLETITTPDSANGYYMDNLVNQYLKLYQIHQTLEPDASKEALVNAVLDDLAVEAAVEMKQFGSVQPVNQYFQVYYRMFAYIIMVLITLLTSTILMTFKRPDLKMRNLVSPLKPRTQTGWLTVYGFLVSIAAWTLMVLTGFIIYGPNLSDTDGRLIALMLLNSFVLMLVALSIAMLASQFIRGTSAQNAVSNFLGLSLCFLGGAFVPLEMLSEGLLKVAQFTPVYWYTTALNKLCNLAVIDQKNLQTVWEAMGIQLLFAATILCVSMAVSRYQSRAENSFGSVNTEFEA